MQATSPDMCDIDSRALNNFAAFYRENNGSPLPSALQLGAGDDVLMSVQSSKIPLNLMAEAAAAAAR